MSPSWELDVREEAEHRPAVVQLDDLRGPIGASQQIGRIVAGVDVAKPAAALLDAGVEERRVFVGAGGLVEEGIHPSRQLGQRQVPLRRDHPQRRVHHGHYQSRGDAFARHVCHRDPDLSVSEIDEVVVRLAAFSLPARTIGGDYRASRDVTPSRARAVAPEQPQCLERLRTE